MMKQSNSTIRNNAFSQTPTIESIHDQALTLTKQYENVSRTYAEQDYNESLLIDSEEQGTQTGKFYYFAKKSMQSQFGQGQKQRYGQGQGQGQGETGTKEEISQNKIMKQLIQPNPITTKFKPELTLKSLFSRQSETVHGHQHQHKYKYQSQSQSYAALEHLQHELNHYQQKCIMYQQMNNRQEQMIANLREQLKLTRDQLQSYKLATKAKIEGNLKIKNLQIASLHQQIKTKDNQIHQLQTQLKSRNKASNITIQYKDTENEQYVCDLEELLCEQQKQLTASKERVRQLQEELEEFAGMAIDQQAKIVAAHELIQIMRVENGRIDEERRVEMLRNKKLGKLMEKSERKIREMGALLVSIANEECRTEQKYKKDASEQS